MGKWIEKHYKSPDRVNNKDIMLIISKKVKVFLNGKMGKCLNISRQKENDSVEIIKMWNIKS